MSSPYLVEIVNVGENSRSATPAEINIAAVRNILHENEHPHPLAMLAIVVAVLSMIYYMYITLMKPSLSGEWVNGDQKIHIHHNKWCDSLNVHGAGYNMQGYLIGTAIHLIDNDGRKILGIVHKNSIYWAGSFEKWQRPLLVC